MYLMHEAIGPDLQATGHRHWRSTRLLAAYPPPFARLASWWMTSGTPQETSPRTSTGILSELYLSVRKFKKLWND